MGKGKKKKNVDFQKVKLKVGKKLSKGDNITNLSFKTRQIQLTQTIRTGETELPVTKRNLSIQDLLRQCEHHGVGVRVNAINGIKEILLENFTDFLVPSNVFGYGAIMKKMSSMLIDSESDVRHHVINLFKLIFSKLKANTQSTSADSLMSGNLFAHIHAYLCCAMNHIHEDVRLDSLILFDALLESFPQTMVQQTGDLLKNLIGMISSPISIGPKANVVSQRLSMNPDSKLPVMKFRARVLLRLKLTLQVATLEMTKANIKWNDPGGINRSVWSVLSEDSEDGTKQNTLLVSHEQANRFGMIFKGAACDAEDYIIKSSSLEDFIKISIPILLQCWKEAEAGGQTDSVAGASSSVDALEVMSLTINVIELLFSLSASNSLHAPDSRPRFMKVSNTLLKDSYEKPFAQDFMSRFPHSSHIEGKTSKKRKLKEQTPGDHAITQTSLTALNLGVCHIMSHFCTSNLHNRDRSWQTKVLQYVVKRFDASPSLEQTRMLIRILKNFFQNPSLLANFLPAYQAAYKYFIKCKVKLLQKRELYDLFSSIIKQWDGHLGKEQSENLCGRYAYSAQMEKILAGFLKGLPKLVLKLPRETPSDLDWIKQVLKCISGNLSLSNSPSSGMEDLKQNLTGILGLMSIDDESVQQSILSLLSFGPCLSKDQLKQVLIAMRRPAAKPALQHRKSRSLACQAVTTISQGIRRNVPLSSQTDFNQMESDKKDSLSDYLKFLFSLLIGMSKEEMEGLLPVKKDAPEKKWKVVDYTVEKEQWNRHKDIAVTVCQELANLQIPASPGEGYDCPFTFINDMEKLWTHTLTHYSNVHILAAYGLVQFIRCMSMKHLCDDLSAEFSTLTSHVMACVLASFYLPDMKSDKVIRDVAEDMKTEIVSCLRRSPTHLSVVWNVLHKRKDSSDTDYQGKQAVIKSLEFILSDDQLKALLIDNKICVESVQIADLSE